MFVFQENYERMKILVDELKSRTEKIKLGKWEVLPAVKIHNMKQQFFTFFLFAVFDEKCNLGIFSVVWLFVSCLLELAVDWALDIVRCFSILLKLFQGTPQCHPPPSILSSLQLTAVINLLLVFFLAAGFSNISSSALSKPR